MLPRVKPRSKLEKSKGSTIVLIRLLDYVIIILLYICRFDSSPRANTNDREISSNDRTGHESDDSRSGDESESLWERGSANSKEEEEDLHRKEEELRAELNFATLRVNELKRTLQETKSFIKAPPSRAGATKHSPTARQVERVPSEDVQEEEDEEEYDEDDDYNLHEADEEDEVRQIVLSGNLLVTLLFLG